jgi:hypothetical protein
MPRHVIIGDVHGMRAALEELLARVELEASDTVIFVGDLLDRGPDSAAVVSVVRRLAARRPVVLVKGNHEAKHERYRRARAISPEHAATIRGARELEAITRELSADDLDFLSDSVLWCRIPEHASLVVHAGIPPRMVSLPGAGPRAAGSRNGGQQEAGAEPEEEPLLGPTQLGSLVGEERSWAEQMLRVRWVRGRACVELAVQGSLDLDPRDDRPAIPSIGDVTTLTGKVTHREFRPEGEYLPLGAEGPDDPYWAAIYDGRFGHVYFGHNPFSGAKAPIEFLHATALDLGAVYGGRLAAAVLEPGARPRLVTVATG